MKKRTDSSPCSVPGCSGSHRGNHIMCRKCWSVVPVTIRSRIMSEARSARRKRPRPKTKDMKRAIKIAEGKL